MASGVNGSRVVQSKGKAASKNSHKLTEKIRRDGEKELYDKVPGIVKKHGIKLDEHDNKKFVTKRAKLEALLECIEGLEDRVKHLEDEVQELLQELGISDTKAKQSEDKAQRVSQLFVERIR